MTECDDAMELEGPSTRQQNDCRHPYHKDCLTSRPMTPPTSNPSHVNSYVSSPPPITRLSQLQFSDTPRVGRLSAPSKHVSQAENADLNIGTAGGLRRPSTSDENEFIHGDHVNLAGPGTVAQGLGPLAMDNPGSDAPSMAREYATYTRDVSIGRAAIARTDPLAAVGGQFVTCYSTETGDYAGSLHAAITQDSLPASILDNENRHCATSPFVWVGRRVEYSQTSIRPCGQPLAYGAECSANDGLSSYSRVPQALIDGAASWRDTNSRDTGMDSYTNKVDSETGVLDLSQQDQVMRQAKASSYYDPSVLVRDTVITNHAAAVSDQQWTPSPLLQTPNTRVPPSLSNQGARVGPGWHFRSTEVNKGFLQSSFNTVDLSGATAHQGPLRFWTRSSSGPVIPSQLPAQPISAGSPSILSPPTASCLSLDGTLKCPECGKIVSRSREAERSQVELEKTSTDRAW